MDGPQQGNFHNNLISRRNGRILSLGSAVLLFQLQRRRRSLIIIGRSVCGQILFPNVIPKLSFTIGTLKSLIMKRSLMRIEIVMKPTTMSGVINVPCRPRVAQSHLALLLCERKHWRVIPYGMDNQIDLILKSWRRATVSTNTIY